MKIFIDTANIEKIREVNSWGILDGVTTNPSLVAKENTDFETLVKQICCYRGWPHICRGNERQGRGYGQGRQEACQDQ